MCFFHLADTFVRQPRLFLLNYPTNSVNHLVLYTLHSKISQIMPFSLPPQLQPSDYYFPLPELLQSSLNCFSGCQFLLFLSKSKLTVTSLIKMLFFYAIVGIKVKPLYMPYRAVHYLSSVYLPTSSPSQMTHPPLTRGPEVWVNQKAYIALSLSFVVTSVS